MSEKAAFLIIAALLFCQLIYGFLFPSCGFSDNWQPIDTYLPKFSAASSDSFLLSKVYPLISKDYRLNSDVGNYLELAKNFGPQIFDGHVFTNRPLYPFLIFLISLPVRFFISPSYGVIFGSAILLNFILIVLGCWLFWRLLKDVFSLRVAWIAAVLLIFSPFVHSFFNQPLAEMLMAFSVVLSAYLIRNYAKNPSVYKLVVFSLIIGVFMLGKMFFATSFFILMMALYFKRYREGVIFGAIQILPLFLWYLWVTQIWGLNYFVNEVQNWQMGVWIFSLLGRPGSEVFRLLINFVPSFFIAVISSFLLIPVIFSSAGFSKLPFRSRGIFYFGPMLAVFLLGFLISFYYIRHTFLLFPIIYPTAALGMIRAADYLKRYGRWQELAFYAIVIGFIVAVSNINIYQIFDYNG